MNRKIKRLQTKIMQTGMRLDVAVKRLNRGEAALLIRSVTGANGMIVTDSIEDLEIPHEPGNTIGIRQLSGLEMDEAEALNSAKSTRRYAALGAEVIQSLREGRDDTVAPTDTDPVDQYDHEFLLIHAIMRWSGNYYSRHEPTPENKKGLDKPTKEWIVKEIIARNHIPLVKSETSEISTIRDISQET